MKTNICVLLTHKVGLPAPFSELGDIYFIVEHVNGPIIEYAELSNLKSGGTATLFKFDAKPYYKHKDTHCVELDDLLEDVQIIIEPRSVRITYNKKEMEKAKMLGDLMRKGANEQGRPISVRSSGPGGSISV
ncbi:MAG: hypothetical protein CMB80_08105 [Flammeovirgaceae bacterium]|nr:hypothetical protein [Flammeovirgaceae bacterium]|tara:strand:- start:4248 stop:4643 length:396 start_codon:yes stop_codon:yes gene_type:complete